MLCALIGLSAVSAQAQFYYVGPSGGDFFDEANWNDAADGSGNSIVGDELMDSTTNAISLDLIVDGDTVEAAGQVDFGTGSLTLEAGSSFTISGAGNDLDINSDSSFSLTDATLLVDDILNFEGTSAFAGGSVTSVSDDIAFQDNFVNLSIDGTTFFTPIGSSRNIYFDGFAGSINNATFTSGDRLGLRNNVSVVATDSSFTIEDGTGDIENIFGTGTAVGSSLTLLGASNLVADSVEEGAALILDGSTTATMGGQGIRIVDADSSITVNSKDVSLNIESLDSSDIDFFDARTNLISGLTGLSYDATNGEGWNITNWDGASAITLQVVPEPASAVMALLGFVAVAGLRRRQ